MDYKIAREFMESNSWGAGPSCPLCHTRKTQPWPGCLCPQAHTHGKFPYTRHIMQIHHRCVFPKQYFNMTFDAIRRINYKEGDENDRRPRR